MEVLEKPFLWPAFQRWPLSKTPWMTLLLGWDRLFEDWVVLLTSEGATAMPSESNRFARQEDLVPRDRLADIGATVIGVGAIGDRCAATGSRLAAPRIQLVDFDVVDDTNRTTQGYAMADVGMTKVLATLTAIRQIDPTIQVETVEDRYRPRVEAGEAVFCCVDSIEARAAIWRSAQRHCRFWCDGRMLGEVLRVLAVADAQGREHYPTTLFA